MTDIFMDGYKPKGLQRGRGGFLRSADDSPYVTDPSGKIVATGPRKGEIARLKYGSPSNRGREIENDAGLVKYKQRLSLAGIGMSEQLRDACQKLATLTVGSPEFNTAADAITVKADELTRSSLAADRGTHGHALTEALDRQDDETLMRLYGAGDQIGLTFDTCLATVHQWVELLERNALEILAIEAACVDDRWRLAGTLDRIVRLHAPLLFAKPGGELVEIPAGTVIVLDIKFGRCRKAHPIQIASYAQSVPYDTETEQRGVWPFSIDQDHALIAHGNFGDDFTPPTIELVWVDLKAGREHGGQCVVDAKSWAARDDVFSVAQIAVGAAPANATEPSTAAGEGNADSSLRPSPASTDAMPLFERVQQAYEAEVGTIDDPALWAKIDEHFQELLPLTHVWIGQLNNQASKHGVPFNRSLRTERAYHIARGLIGLCLRDAGEDEILAALLTLVVGEPGPELGHNLGLLNADGAKQFADLVDRFNRDQLKAYLAEDHTLRLFEPA